MMCQKGYHFVVRGSPYCLCGKQGHSTLPSEVETKSDPDLAKIKEQLDRIERKIDAYIYPGDSYSTHQENLQDKHSDNSGSW